MIITIILVNLVIFFTLLMLPEEISEIKFIRKIYEMGYWDSDISIISFARAIVVYLLVIFITGVTLSLAHLIIGLLLGVTLIEIRNIYVQKSMERSCLPLLRSINSKMIWSNDIIAILGKSGENIESKYLKFHIKEFETQIKLGAKSEKLFDKLKSVRHTYLSYIFLNIEQVYIRKGNVRELMLALEQQYMEIQTEIERSKIEVRGDRMAAGFTMVLTLLSGASLLRNNWEYFIYHPLILGVIGILIGVAIWIYMNTLIAKEI